MTFPPVISHFTQRNATLDQRLDVPEPVAVTVLPANDKNAEEVQFDQTDAIALFKKKVYKVHMSVEHTSMSTRTVTVFDTGTGPNLLPTSFLPHKWRDCMTSSITCLSSLHETTLSMS